MRNSTFIVMGILILIGALLGGSLLGWYLKPTINPNPPKPDTIYREYYYPAKTIGDSLPPTKVIIYNQIPDLKLPTKAEYKDSLIYLKDTNNQILSITHPGFLTFMPGNPKILSGTFTEEGLSLDLLDTSGTIHTLAYKTDYSSKNYHFNGSFITFTNKNARSIPGISKSRYKMTTNSNLYLTYDIFQKTPYIAADYSISLGKLGIYSLAGVGYNQLTQNTTAHINVGLKLTLK